jgi:hypothetical protein
MIRPAYIDRLDDCESGCSEGTPCEMKAAMRWLAEKARPYSVRFIPPMTRKESESKTVPFAAFTVRIRRKHRLSSATMVGRIDLASDHEGNIYSTTLETPDATAIASALLSRSRAGWLFLTTGRNRNVLDIMLEAFGQGLCDMGYAISPCISGSRVAFVTIRKGRRKWTWGYAETAAGVPASILLDYARDVNASLSPLYQRGDARALYNALGAYASFLADHFGVALSPTAGMIAIQCARRYLPEDYKKWKPTPLLVAMERDGRGYRGGMTHAVRYRGKTWRIDVNRQYTNALAARLPYRSAFGRYVSEEKTPDGVFLCHVRIRNGCTYQLGVWSGHEAGFISKRVGTGDYVSVLHTTEFDGLRRSGSTVTPGYGYIFTHCYSFRPYKERLQSLLDLYGKDSAAGRLTKPLGNYVYGKLGQNPKRKDLMFSKDKPADSAWIQYMDDDLRFWPMVWERDTKVVTSTQHVDMAGAITGAARSQTMSMWHAIETAGAHVLRVHTDSLTLDRDPRLLEGVADSIDPDIIGMWKLESEEVDSVIVGANAYIDQDGAHIAGVSDPTWEMIERIYDGHVAYVVQQENAPLAGFARRAREVRKEYG